MAKYKDLVGTAVRDIAGDDGVVTGQLWYNTSENEYRYKRQFKGDSWSTQPALNTARNNVSGATAGTTSATIAFGGFAPPHVAGTESWNGSSWTEVNDLNTARNNSQSSNRSFCGVIPHLSISRIRWIGRNFFNFFSDYFSIG